MDIVGLRHIPWVSSPRAGMSVKKLESASYADSVGKMGLHEVTKPVSLFNAQRAFTNENSL